MSEVHAAGNSIFCAVPSKIFEPRPKLVGFADRDRQDMKRDLPISPTDLLLRELHFSRQPGETKERYRQLRARRARTSSSEENRAGNQTEAHTRQPADPSSGLRKTARKDPATLRRKATDGCATACDRREGPKPRRLIGRKGGLKRCQ